MMELSVSSSRALEAIERICQQGNHHNVVFVSGLFNILHPGHLRLLRFASECGDLLVVGVLADHFDTTGRLMPSQSRLEFLQVIEWVDYAFVLDDSPEQFVAALRPARVVKGREHEQEFNPEQAVLDQYGGKIIFSSGPASFSSHEILQIEDSETAAIRLPEAYRQRHHFSLDDIEQVLRRFETLKVAVIGDTIVDEYVQCDPLGMSQEDPTIVVTPTDIERFLGGAAIVAGHVRGLGANAVHYFSVIGDDDSAGFVRERSGQYGVKGSFETDDSRPTTVKQRFRSRNKTLLRVNHLRQHPISQGLQNTLYKNITESISGFDLLLFSDFNYGVLPQKLVDRLIGFCEQNKIMMAADSQCSSQLGDVSRFNNMAFLSPTEHEARVAMRNHDDGLVVLAEQLRKKANAQHVFITMAEEGVLIHACGEGNHFITDKLPAFNTSPVDVAGAGDCFMAATAMAVAAKADIWLAAYMGSLAAACQVSKVGNTPLTAAALRKVVQV